ASSFLDFVEKLHQAGLVQLKHSGRSVMVELNEGFSSDGEPPVEGAADTGVPQTSGGAVAQASGAGVAQPSGAGVAQGFRPANERAANPRAATEPPAGPQLGTNADGVR